MMEEYLQTLCIGRYKRTSKRFKEYRKFYKLTGSRVIDKKYIKRK